MVCFKKPDICYFLHSFIRASEGKKRKGKLNGEKDKTSSRWNQVSLLCKIYHKLLSSCHQHSLIVCARILPFREHPLLHFAWQKSTKNSTEMQFCCQIIQKLPSFILSPSPTLQDVVLQTWAESFAIGHFPTKLICSITWPLLIKFALMRIIII